MERRFAQEEDTSNDKEMDVEEVLFVGGDGDSPAAEEPRDEGDTAEEGAGAGGAVDEENSSSEGVEGREGESTEESEDEENSGEVGRCKLDPGLKAPSFKSST